MPFALALALSIASAVAHVELVIKQAGVATGHIRGRVFDEYGASIPDASVSFQALNLRSGLAPFEAVADSRGRFDFVRVRPGTYRVTAKALGYETTVMTQEVMGGVETDMTVVVRRRLVFLGLEEQAELRSYRVPIVVRMITSCGP